MTTPEIWLDPEPTDLDARPGKGAFKARFVFVGMAPSTKRPASRINQPFGASSYKLLERILGAIDEPIYVTNLVKIPVKPSKKPGVKVVRKYYPGLVNELKVVLAPQAPIEDAPKPRILALGAVVAQMMCPGFGKMSDDHGTLFYNPELDAIVVPTYHFSAVARDPQKKPYLARDLERFFSLPDPEEPLWIEGRAVDISGAQFNSAVLDIETKPTEEFEKTKKAALNPYQSIITMIGMDFEGADVPFIFTDPTTETLVAIHDWYVENGVILIGHNLQFDLWHLSVHSRVSWADVAVQDTMVAAYVEGEPLKNLKHLSTTHTDRSGPRAFGGVESPAYCAEDVMSTRAIHTHYLPTFEKEATKLINQLIPFVVHMRLTGVHVDTTALEDVLLPDYQERVRVVETDLLERAGVEMNWNSNPQVVEFLLQQGVTLTDKTPGGDFSVAESVLLSLKERYPIVGQLLAYREAEKRLDFLESYRDFLAASPVTRLHPNLKLTSTRTGRPSCADPNLQQVEREGPLKTLFPSRFEGGFIGLVDLAQAELRVAALVSNDSEFAVSLMAEDPHRQNAAMVYNKDVEDVTAKERKKSKGVTFGLLYGGSPWGLAKKVETTEADVQHIMDVYFEKFPALMGWLDSTKEQALYDLNVTTPFGRYRDFKALHWAEGEWSVQRKAVNTPIQATASDINMVIFLFLLRSFAIVELKSKVLVSIHDSVMLDIHPAELEQVVELVADAFFYLNSWSSLAQFPLWGTLPIVGELIVGSDWAHVESTNENYHPDEIYPVTSYPEVVEVERTVEPDDEDPWGIALQEELDLEAAWEASVDDWGA